MFSIGMVYKCAMCHHVCTIMEPGQLEGLRSVRIATRTAMKGLCLKTVVFREAAIVPTNEWQDAFVKAVDSSE